MEQLNYRPNSIAQSLASNRSNSIGVMVSELNGSFFGQMMAGIEKTLRNANKHVIITSGHNEEKFEKEGIEFLISRNCDALIIHVEAVSDQDLVALSQGDIPIYLISHYVEALKEKCISLDNEMGGYLSTKAALEQGHRDIAYIAGPQSKADPQSRLLGHKRALAEYEIPFNQALYFGGDFKDIGGSAGIKHFIDTNQTFSALVCANDEMASGAMTYAREHGLNLPQDLSVIGFDNVLFARHIHPKLTTVENPVYEMGTMAATLVLRDVYQKPAKQIKQHFQPTLIARDSVAPYNKG